MIFGVFLIKEINREKGKGKSFGEFVQVIKNRKEITL
jgi:hypothetical protein